MTETKRAYVVLREGPRIVSVKAGFHNGEMGPRYGCGGDLVFLAYQVSDDFVGSISLNMNSVRGEELQTARGRRQPHGGPCQGEAFATHRGFPIRIGEVQAGKDKCEFLAAGECYGDVGYLRGDAFYSRELRDTVAEEFLRSSDYEEHAAWLLQQEPLWEKLKAEAHADAVSDHTQRIEPCPACNGSGVAP